MGELGDHDKEDKGTSLAAGAESTGIEAETNLSHLTSPTTTTSSPELAVQESDSDLIQTLPAPRKTSPSSTAPKVEESDGVKAKEAHYAESAIGSFSDAVEQSSEVGLEETAAQNQNQEVSSDEDRDIGT
jgi:hypothetical protein